MKMILIIYFFQTLLGPETNWVVGIPFLKNVYSVFDQGDMRVGFAKLKGLNAFQAAGEPKAPKSPKTASR